MRVGVLVIDRAAIDRERSVEGRHDVRLARLALLKQRCRDERFERGPGLVRLGERRAGGVAQVGTMTGHGEHLAVGRIDDDDVTALRTHPRDRIRQRTLGDLLELLIDGEDDAVALHRRRGRSGWRLETPAERVPHDSRRAGRASEQRVQRELDAVHRVAVRIHAPNDAARALGEGVGPLDDRRRVHAAHGSHRCDVDCQIASRQRDPAARRIGGARDPLVRDFRTLKRRPKLAEIAHFLWRNIDLHRLAALCEQLSPRVEDLTARCRNSAGRALLVHGARRVASSVPELHASGLHQQCDDERGQGQMNDAHAAGARHGMNRGMDITWLSAGTCRPNRSATGSRRPRLDAARISPSRRIRSLIIAARRASSSRNSVAAAMPTVRRRITPPLITRKASISSTIRMRPPPATLPVAMRAAWRCEPADCVRSPRRWR